MRPWITRAATVFLMLAMFATLAPSQAPLLLPPTSVSPQGESDLAESQQTGPFPAVLPGVGPSGVGPAGTGQPGKSAPPVQLAMSGELMGFSHVDAQGTQTITLVHAGKSWMAVYHVESTGVIRLVSSRPIDADFSLELNATSPLPDEIRALGGGRSKN